MKKTYRVMLPIQVGEFTFQYGEEVDLDADQARAYAHAIAPLTAEDTLARDNARIQADQAALAADQARLKPRGK